MNRALFLAAYDIRDRKRLRRALRVVKGFASGGQRSAYECWLSPTDARKLLGEMREVTDTSEDQFALIPLDPRREAITLGIALKPVDPAFHYFG